MVGFRQLGKPEQDRTSFTNTPYADSVESGRMPLVTEETLLIWIPTVPLGSSVTLDYEGSLWGVGPFSNNLSWEFANDL